MGISAKPGPVSANERTMYRRPEEPVSITSKYQDLKVSAAVKRADPCKPPSKLSPAAKRHWRTLMKSAPHGHFQDQDLALLAVFCSQLELYDRFQEEVSGLDTLVSASGNSPHPAVKGLQGTAVTLTTMAAKLALCPSSQDKTKGGKKSQHDPWWKNRT